MEQLNFGNSPYSPRSPRSPPQLFRAEGKKGQAALLCLATQPLSRGAERATQPVSHLQPGIEHTARNQANWREGVFGASESDTWGTHGMLPFLGPLSS